MTTRTNKPNHSNIFRTIAAAVLLAGACLFGTGCGSSDMSDDPVPYVPFDAIVINLNLPAYAGLKTNNYVYVNDGGVRGLILFRQSNTSYLAFERNCTYHPNEACSTVEVHSSTLYMVDACCSSTFNFQGEPTGGPAWRPLIQYNTSLKGTELTITDDRL